MNSEIIITEDELKDQRERMVENFGYTEEQAEELFEDIKTYVQLKSQDLGKNWNDEAIDAVTNLILAIQTQYATNQAQRRARFYERLYNFLSGILIAALAGFAVVGFKEANIYVAVAMTLATFTAIYFHSKHA